MLSGRRVGLFRCWIDDGCAVAYRPNAREPRDFQSGVNNDASFLQFNWQLRKVRVWGNASSPYHDGCRDCLPTAAVHCPACVGDNSSVELYLDLAVRELLLCIPAKRVAKFRKNHAATVDQDNAHFARINLAVVREDVPGEKRLVAYFIPREPAEDPSVEGLRAQLKAVLPEYMVPSAFVMLERMPLTTNGKLDRRSLPAPEREAYASGQYEAPLGDVEEVLAGIWQELLRVERIGRQDNFFELGGHSLHIMKLIAMIEDGFMLRLSVPAVFREPTIKQMAKVVQALRLANGEPLNSEGAELEEVII